MKKGDNILRYLIACSRVYIKSPYREAVIAASVPNSTKLVEGQNKVHPT